MLRRLRPVTAAVLALAFVAGPVSAACLHGMAHGADHAAMGHEAPAGHGMPVGHGTPMGDAPAEAPCHDEPPAPEPPPVHDCEAPCCTAEPAIEAPAPPAPTADLVAVVRPALGPAWGPEATARPSAPPERPPPPLRRHVELQRFLI